MVYFDLNVMINKNNKMKIKKRSFLVINVEKNPKKTTQQI